MNSKTLKDLNEEFRKENIPQRLSRDEFNDYWEERLKEEAIKWVKERINKKCSIAEKWFWMDKFNITEEDLKEMENNG